MRLRPFSRLESFLYAQTSPLRRDTLSLHNRENQASALCLQRFIVWNCCIPFSRPLPSIITHHFSSGGREITIAKESSIRRRHSGNETKGIVVETEAGGASERNWLDIWRAGRVNNNRLSTIREKRGQESIFISTIIGWGHVRSIIFSLQIQPSHPTAHLPFSFLRLPFCFQDRSRQYQLEGKRSCVNRNSQSSCCCGPCVSLGCWHISRDESKQTLYLYKVLVRGLLYTQQAGRRPFR